MNSFWQILPNQIPFKNQCIEEMTFKKVVNKGKIQKIK